jgi:hypothetical protein
MSRSRRRRWRGWISVGIGLLAFFGAVRATGSDGDPPVPNNPAGEGASEKVAADGASPDPSSSSLRMREGTKLTDQLGDFQKSGDRYNFYPLEGKGVLRVLENLALERVAGVLLDDPSPRTWSVSGVLTEYRGENFLLITRAVLKSRGARPTPSGGIPKIAPGTPPDRTSAGFPDKDDTRRPVPVDR